MARFKITRGESVGAYRVPGRGFTLIELIVVISLIAFLSNVVIKQISTGLEEKNLEATITNVGIYFSNASRLARASGQWVIVVVNVNKADEGFLRQMGTYQWFEGAEPGDLRCIIRRMQFTSLFGRAFLPQPFKRWVNRVIMGQASHVPAAEL